MKFCKNSLAALLCSFIILISTGIANTVLSAQRPVVIEEFTKAPCTACYAGSLALGRIQNNYSRDEVIILAYHNYDSFSISYCPTRVAYYSVTAHPTVWFDGWTNVIGGASQSQGEAGIQQMYNTYVTKIEAEQARTAAVVPFQLLALQGQIGPTDPSLTLRISSTTGYPRSVNAIFLITEDHIPITPSGERSELNSVVRAYLGTRSISLTSGGSVEVSASYTGTIPYTSASQLHPAVLIQDDTTKEILGGLGEFYELTGVGSRWWLYE